MGAPGESGVCEGLRDLTQDLTSTPGQSHEQCRGAWLTPQSSQEPLMNIGMFFLRLSQICLSALHTGQSQAFSFKLVEILHSVSFL